MAYGENYIVFKLSSDGRVRPDPQRHIISTSEEMQWVLQKIVPKVAHYFEALLREELETNKKGR